MLFRLISWELAMRSRTQNGALRNGLKIADSFKGVSKIPATDK